MSHKPTRLDTDQKALEINLNERIYGTFAEIGAGQEVARYFFKVGAAVGTIAKSMSAYDKTYSDRIYGVENSGRYVCESRVYKMLDHEYALMEERLQESRPKNTFFVFADTVAAINFQKTIKGHGWLGLRFQLTPQSEPNDIILHVRMLDTSNMQQQSAIGILGVNLIYAAYYYQDDLEKFVKSLKDDLRNRVCVDMIRLSGPDFEHVDNRLLSLYLIKHKLSDVTMFNHKGDSIHPSEFLYKKSLIVVRGNYKPPTIVSLDVFEQGYRQFKKEYDLQDHNAKIMAEITLQNLTKNDPLDEEDFIQRTDMLCYMGYDIILSNCVDHQQLTNYLSTYKIPNLGIVVGARELLELIDSSTNDEGDDNMLVKFGRLFSKNIRVYVYPVLSRDKQMIIQGSNLPVPKVIRYLYQHLLDRGYVANIDDYRASNLAIFPFEVLYDIEHGIDGWENKLPSGLAGIIKEKGYFNYAKLAPEISES
jgi:hypothetical protein